MIHTMTKSATFGTESGYPEREWGSKIVPILPPKDEPELMASTVYLPEETWERLKQIAAETRAEDPKGKGYNRNEVIMHFLGWAISEYEREKREQKAKGRK